MKQTPSSMSWLKEALPAGYKLGAGVVDLAIIRRGEPILTFTDPDELRVFLQAFVTCASPAVIDADSGPALQKQRDWQDGKETEQS